jgi:hypothetical protein
MDKGWRMSASLPHKPRAGEKKIEGRRGGKCCSPEREGEGHEVAGESPVGGGRRRREGDARETERSTGGGVNGASGSVSGWRPFFKTRYGRTGQSTVPVRCTPDSAQEIGFLARGCRCTGHCTVQRPVHTGLSGEPRQRGVWKILNFSI